ncbi:1-aminocyclopropane-1-carboxylate deaminase/D-cysteine desulfhydrase [Pedobacter heparinus]|uniref:Pyridoxal-5'-phosphate-dependent protein beta subunit n=1 Tax=Pedobacter heparinus (strain ATCC 13125 / DSM 2366 / CIP 104194 / JCM 7457 / NBRC 12017 / NCIMB 9290 / NRRL B-14731 / HIM 762-3) TaxID=485917 RepID=C6XS90_PEDHD|nr:pyridoxal-phosphate dependent enzyme [Pedobacter heparinus]ACU03435.1 Pyridoxal-5'-phosphate-dependent protein beta subunit [Pedobacter heparinus DSM 2366]
MFADIHSPLQPLNFFHGYQVLVKRDDLIDPFISGNKWRKLKYILAEADRTGKNHLVTFGGAYSNHLVATAAACARNGLQSTAFVRGEAVENEMLLLCKLYGMQLRFTDRLSYQNKPLLFDRYFGGDHTALFVDEGGAGPHAVKGCAEIIAELPADTSHLFCAAGTGTTAAGLLKGIQAAQLKTILHVVPVLKGDDFISPEILKYTGPDHRLRVHTGYHFGGYAKTSPALIEFIKYFIAHTGIMIDPVYTSKMCYALADLLKHNHFNPDDKIVVLHTGGLLGLLGMKEKFH